MQSTSSSLTSVFLLSLVVRLPLALVQRTPFQPDETYQSLEPAHRLVFGSGHLTWEWSWNEHVAELGERWAWLAEGRLRGATWVSVWAGVYWLLKALSLDEQLVVVAPKVVMALIAAMCDTATFALARRLSTNSGPTALALSLTSVFHAHVLTRPFANSIETTLTTVAFNFWPTLTPGASSDGEPSRSGWRKALAIAAITCVLRPTNAILWLVPGLSLLGRFVLQRQFKQAATLLLDVTWISLLVLVSSTALDTFLFPPPSTSSFPVTFPPLTFLTHNVILPTSLFFGSNSSHYYLSQGLPVLLGLLLPWTLCAIVSAALERAGRGGRELVFVLAATTAVYSTIGHKEWRFLHPVLPLLHALTAIYLTRSPTSPSQTPKGKRSKPPGRSFPVKLILFLTLTALPQVWYLSTQHGAAQHAVIAYLRHVIPQGGSLGVLMPCHSTPWQSHLHRPDLDDAHAWFLTCPPPKGFADARTHLTEQTEFYSDPKRYLTLNFPPIAYPSAKSLRTLRRLNPNLREWPSHLAFFGALLSEGPNGPEVATLLRERGYTEDEGWAGGGGVVGEGGVGVWNGWDLVQDDWRRWGGVRVWKLRDKLEGEGL